MATQFSSPVSVTENVVSATITAPPLTTELDELNVGKIFSTTLPSFFAHPIPEDDLKRTSREYIRKGSLVAYTIAIRANNDVHEEDSQLDEEFMEHWLEKMQPSVKGAVEQLFPSGGYRAYCLPAGCSIADIPVKNGPVVLCVSHVKEGEEFDPEAFLKQKRLIMQRMQKMQKTQKTQNLNLELRASNVENFVQMLQTDDLTTAFTTFSLGCVLTGTQNPITGIGLGTITVYEPPVDNDDDGCTQFVHYDEGECTQFVHYDEGEYTQCGGQSPEQGCHDQGSPEENLHIAKINALTLTIDSMKKAAEEAAKAAEETAKAAEETHNKEKQALIAENERLADEMNNPRSHDAIEKDLRSRIAQLEREAREADQTILDLTIRSTQETSSDAPATLDAADKAANEEEMQNLRADNARLTDEMNNLRSRAANPNTGGVVAHLPSSPLPERPTTMGDLLKTAIARSRCYNGDIAMQLKFPSSVSFPNGPVAPGDHSCAEVGLGHLLNDGGKGTLKDGSDDHTYAYNAVKCCYTFENMVVDEPTEHALLRIGIIYAFSSKMTKQYRNIYTEDIRQVTAFCSGSTPNKGLKRKDPPS